jgi:hypothetical protein
LYIYTKKETQKRPGLFGFLEKTQKSHNEKGKVNLNENEKEKEK